MSHLVLGVIVTLIRKDVIEFVMIPSTLSKEIRMGILFESYIMHKCECFLRLIVYVGHFVVHETLMYSLLGCLWIMTN